MDDFEHSMTRIASCIKAGARQVLPGGPLWIGEVKEAGGGRLRVSCGGMQLEREDLWVAAGLDFAWTMDTGGAELLRRGPPSLSPPRGTRASAWLPWALPGATG